MAAALVFALFLLLASVGIHFGLRKEFKTYDNGIVLVTGASTGIGRDACLDLASIGFTVYAGVRKTEDGENVVKQASQKKVSGKIVPIILDVTDESHIQKAFKTISEHVSSSRLPFVALVNNAGISDLCPLEAMPTDVAKNMFEVNYWGAIRTTQLFLPLIRKYEGRIVSVSSVAGMLVAPGYGTYSGTKYALEAGMDAFRRELARFGCSVSIVEPGFVITDIKNKASMSLPSVPEEQKKLYSNIFNHYGKASIQNAPGPEVTSAAIRHAITSQYPNTRYPVAGANGFPAYVLSLLASFFPDRAADLMIEVFG